MKDVYIQVNSRPVSVSYDCPYCEEEIEIDYNDFCDRVGEPCDWNYSIIKCPECDKKFRIDSVDWQ